MSEGVLHFLLRLVLDVFLYWTGKIAILVVTLGRWQVNPYETGSSWWIRKPNGKLYLCFEIAFFAGFLFWCFVALIIAANPPAVTSVP